MRKTLIWGPHDWFDNTMKEKKWIDSPGWRVATISAISPNEVYNTHWFSNKCTQNFNLDIDDVNIFYDHPRYYDLGYDYYRRGYHTYADAFCSYISGNFIIHGISFSESVALVKFIDDKILKGYDSFYIHCQVGISRSAAISYYILDRYKYINWDVTHISPYIMPNQYVYKMLNLAYDKIYKKFPF